jgi:hypothetical protein
MDRREGGGEVRDREHQVLRERVGFEEYYAEEERYAAGP